MNFQRRIVRDLNMMSDVKHQTLYFKSDPNATSIIELKALIIAPEDSVYQGGFFLFETNLSQYPFHPPKFKFITPNPNERLHPNFYGCGKVCFDFLGTFGNNNWSPATSLPQILLCFESVLDSNPIRHEPSFKHVTLNDPNAKNYAIISRYLTLITAFRWIKTNHSEYGQIIRNYFHDHLTIYQSSIDLLRPYHGQRLSSIHNQNVLINVDDLQSQYSQLQTQLTNQSINI